MISTFAVAALLPLGAFAAGLPFAPVDMTDATSRPVIWDIDLDDGVNPGQLFASFDPTPGIDPNDIGPRGIGTQVPFGLTCDPTVSGCLTGGDPVVAAGADGLLGTADDVHLGAPVGANIGLNPFRAPSFGPGSILAPAVGLETVAAGITNDITQADVALSLGVASKAGSFAPAQLSSDGTTATVTLKERAIRDQLRVAAVLATFGPDSAPFTADDDPNASLLLPVDAPAAGEVPWADGIVTVDVATGAANYVVSGTVYSNALAVRLPFLLDVRTGPGPYVPTPAFAAAGAFTIPGTIPGIQDNVNVFGSALDFFCTVTGTGGHLSANTSVVGDPNGTGTVEFTALGGASLTGNPCIQQTTIPYDPATGVIFAKGPIFAGTLLSSNDSGTIGLREVPEPGTVLLLGAGLAGLAMLRRRKV
ncbi:MAG: PEP-CTERM sorting domain-containing protein [Myxococcota bacterium]